MKTYCDLLSLAMAFAPVQAAEVKPIEPVTNFFVDFDEEGKEAITPLSMAAVVERILERTDGWPRRIKGSLFVHDDSGIHWLPNASALFGWLSSRCGVIEWRRSVGCVTKDEVFHELCRTVKSYVAVESIPHFPPIPDHYYACRDYEPGNGDAIDKLVSFFSPETNEDRQLILAMFATPFWGGKPGSRPAFLITSDAGRGVGKSKITDMLSCLIGGHIELSAGEDASRMRTRLLSPEGLKMRLARLDNVKTLRFSWAELESIITSPVISGHRLHTGEAARPNNLLWVITLNGASLSTDMAQRVIIIKLVRPQRIGAWESDVISFIENNRDAIISDIKSFLEIEPEPIPDHTRWASWEDEIVGRLEFPYRVKSVIDSRTVVSDVEKEELGIIEDHFCKRIIELGYLESDVVFIPSSIAADWLRDATKEIRSVSAACRVIGQSCEEGSITVLEKTRGKNMRGFYFFGSESKRDDESKKNTKRDLETRIEKFHENKKLAFEEKRRSRNQMIF